VDTEGVVGPGEPDEPEPIGDRSGLPARRGPVDLRVSDAERAAALEALGAHLEAGRLDIDEFGERSARAAVAVRRSDLEPLFVDLPAPHPPLPHPHVPPRPPAAAEPSPVAEQGRDRRPATAGSAGPALGVALVMLLVLVLPALLVGAAATGSAGGLLVLPLLFLVLGGARHGRWHGRGHGPGGHGHGGRHGPHGRW
jgi:hypothetical protein